MNGSIDSNSMGLTLTHEHIMSNFGAERNTTYYYDENLALGQIIPYLKTLKITGVQTIFDCTTAYFGRRVDLLKKIADSTGIQIVTNTGYYGAAQDKYIPNHAYQESAQQLAQRWISEFEKGIDSTTIKPGFIKLAFDSGTPSEIDLKLFEAGILTHIKTGLTLAVHTGNNKDALETQLKLLTSYNVSYEHLVWVHAHKMEEVNYLLEQASKGVWISLDGITSTNTEDYINVIQKFKAQNLLHKILLSHDGNSYPNGKAIRPYNAITTLLIPSLRAHGFTEDDIKTMCLENPKDAFAMADQRN